MVGNVLEVAAAEQAKDLFTEEGERARYVYSPSSRLFLRLVLINVINFCSPARAFADIDLSSTAGVNKNLCLLFRPGEGTVLQLFASETVKRKLFYSICDIFTIFYSGGMIITQQI